MLVGKGATGFTNIYLSRASAKTMHILDALHHKRIRFGMEECSRWWISGEVGAVGARVGVEASGWHTVAAIACICSVG